MATLTSITAVKNQLAFDNTLTGTLTDDTVLTDDISQASVMFETVTGRTFGHSLGTLYLDNCPPHRYGRKLYFRQDVAGVDAIVNGDGSTLTSSHYRLLPQNSPPYYAAELKRGAGKVWQNRNSTPEGAIFVMGTLGYNTDGNHPADVEMAVTRLAAWLYQTRDNKYQTIRYADGSAELPPTAPPLTLEVAKRYTRDMLTVGRA